MAKKTNKTSHVLDLLTHGTSSDTADTAAPSPAGSQKKVTVVDEGSRNDKVSQEILSKLSEELERENAEGAGGQETAAEPEAAGTSAQGSAGQAQEAAPVQEEQPQAASVQETETQPQTAPVQETPAADAPIEEQIQLDAPDQREELAGDDDDFHFVNVMEQLLEKQDISGFMKQYNVCTCKRCNADVRALTLTALPAKYVVIGKHSFSPVLNFYENKFKIEMLTALSKACSAVRDTPHHKR